MLLHSSPLFQIYFGNAKDALYQDNYLQLPQQIPLLEQEPFNKLKKVMRINDALFLHQVHGADGVVVSTPEQLAQLRPFSTDGDFLITNVKDVGIGTVSADCLPLILFDSFNHVVGSAHAGWRGSVGRVAVRLVERMQREFGTKLEHLQVFFGPSIKVCCYVVQQDFLVHLDEFSVTNKVIQQHGQELFFDLPLFNRLQLEGIGIKKEAFHLDYNKCTSCDTSFYSYRRQGEEAGRQMTVVALK